MSSEVLIKRALVSVSDKRGLTRFVRWLHERGVQIISTGGTARALREAGVSVTEVSDYTGSPEILDGRVKTLHPKVHGGILAIRGNPEHKGQMAAGGTLPIDLVVVNLYPFEETVAREGVSFGEALENIDIGGPTLLRAAAKNHEYVVVVTDPSDYDTVIKEMDENGGAVSAGTKFRLAKKAFAATARYDTAIATYLSGISDDKAVGLDMPRNAGFMFEMVQPLRYGENPHQKAAFYRDMAPGAAAGPGIVGSRQLQGKGLSYNNIMDADAALSVVRDFAQAPFAAVIVKHSNPCGVATSLNSSADALSKALACDPVSAFGGIVGFTRAVDEAVAATLAEGFYEVIMAPGFDGAALNILRKKKNLRLLEVAGIDRPGKEAGFDFRQVFGGMLLQERDAITEDVRAAKVVTKRLPKEEEWAALGFAWHVCRHVKSNAIVFASTDRTLGIGAGQTSRIDSVRIAAMKMHQQSPVTCHLSLVTVVASDAFFPFRDGVDEAAVAGATAAIQPGGSIRDDEVITAANGHNMAMVFTGIRHFKH